MSADEAASTLLTFVPIPLATGDHFHGETDAPVAVRSIDVVIGLANGTSVSVPLRREHTGWYAP